ncbi:MAG: excinuclease ABC subunit UvrA [Paludibacteraceae bacterium]|nr:excinuclease ABC subunit UvrA [Paludibacteraceae bacterium]
MASQFIHIEGARTHNLKNVSVDIPRNRLTVITGVSGSGKSSLAFDTLYAEGQRRYVESLSAYARQFLGRMQKPDVDRIDGIPPAIAIQQKTISHNPRSTVGTVTEIYEYLKLLYARVGRTYSPVTHAEVKRHSVADVVAKMEQLPINTHLWLLAPIVLSAGRNLRAQLSVWQDQGFSRLYDLSTHETIYISDWDVQEGCDTMYLLVDRVVVDHEQATSNRFSDSVQTAFFEGHGALTMVWASSKQDYEQASYSTRFEADGITFVEPSEHLFDFNNPLGACPRCNGAGMTTGIDVDLVIPDKSKSIYEGAIACWHGETMHTWNDALVYAADKFDFPIHKPYYALTREQKELIWKGNAYFKGLNDFFIELETKQYSRIQYRVLLSRYKGKANCPECAGLRLRKETEYVLVGGKKIQDLIQMPISELTKWFADLRLEKTDAIAGAPLLKEIKARLYFLKEVGLDYLTLNRGANTLSGGESQRINLSKSLGSSLVGSLYVLDEPSIGLHPRDTQLLINALKELRDLKNTIVVVEHDLDIQQAADYIVEVGPKAGQWGGEICYAGVPRIDQNHHDIPTSRRAWNHYIEVKGASENNLKNLTVRFPLNVMTVITGVSGSGKSSLVSRVLYPALKKHYGGVADHTGDFGALGGDLNMLKNVELIDQNPLSKSSRSNPATYLKAYDEIRQLYANQQLAQQLRFSPAYFSFNTPGGRCEVCKGEGVITIEMQFLADLILPCENCHGRRFQRDVLDVLYRDKSIYDVLCMTVDEAIDFFAEDPKCKRIVKRLQPLKDVGLGYIQLGQSSSTLSGGESQRVKLASFLADENNQPTLFIFDEPTTGLSQADIQVLLSALNRLIAKGHTLLIIEHNSSIILAADHIIDLGPEGGEQGGYIVAEGTPEQVMGCEASYTGRYMKSLKFRV